MNYWIKCICYTLVLVGSHAYIQAQTSDSQNVTFSVDAISSIEVSGNPGPLNITAATTTTFPASVSDSSTTYSVSTNVEGPQRITAVLDAAMPTGTSLTVTLEPPPNATSTPVVLSTTPQTAISGIGPTTTAGLTITYTFNAQATAGPIPSTTRTVTFTIGA